MEERDVRQQDRLELDAGHLSLVSHPRQIADLILAAAGRKK
jgi:hypothetical protein